MHLSDQALNDFRLHVLACYPEEACGLVVDGQFVPTKNIAETPLTRFRISSTDILKAEQAGRLQAVLHSHPYSVERTPKDLPETPTTADMVSWLGMSVPWGICATDGEGISQLVWMDEDNPEPLVGRQFLHGINDCYSLVRDWFKQERGITLKNFPRGMDWWSRGADLYDQNFEAAGFVTIPIEEATTGDCVLFKVRSPVTNHAAVITGPNEILHHLFHRLSGHDQLSKWLRVINRAVRYQGPV